MHLSSLWTLIVALIFPVIASAEPPVLPRHRINGEYCIAVGQLAQAYDLGRNQSLEDRCAEYRTATADLLVEEDRRDIHLNGVAHWLNSPIVSKRGRLWIRADDVEKNILPILHPSIGIRPIRTIVLDPGHGGTDSGARGLSGHFEKEWTLDVAQRLARLLEHHGFHVEMTRSGDQTTPLPSRAAFGAAHQADLFISVHFNSGGPWAEGIETYCLTPPGFVSTGNTTGQRGKDSPVTGNRNDRQNLWLAHCIQAGAVDKLHPNDRGVRRARFEVLREATCPAILIEGGFLTNQTDEQKILSVNYRERLAAAIAGGILAYQQSDR